MYGLVGAGHVGAGRLAVLDGVIPVLDPHAAIERQVRELGDVTGGIDVGVAGARVLVDLDAVADLEPGGLGQVDGGRMPIPAITSSVVTMLPLGGVGGDLAAVILEAHHLSSETASTPCSR